MKRECFNQLIINSYWSWENTSKKQIDQSDYKDDFCDYFYNYKIEVCSLDCPYLEIFKKSCIKPDMHFSNLLFSKNKKEYKKNKILYQESLIKIFLEYKNISSV